MGIQAESSLSYRVRCKWTLAEKLTWPSVVNDISVDSVYVDKTTISSFTALYP